VRLHFSSMNVVNIVIFVVVSKCLIVVLFSRTCSFFPQCSSVLLEFAMLGVVGQILVSC